MENFKKTLRREFMQMGGLEDNKIDQIVEKLKKFFGTAYAEVDKEGKSKTYTHESLGLGFGIYYYPFNQYWNEFISSVTITKEYALYYLKELILNLLSGNWGQSNQSTGQETTKAGLDLKIYDFIKLYQNNSSLKEIAKEIADNFGGYYEDITNWTKQANSFPPL